ncbi:MAG TPA: hypothetical protein VF598_06330 [Hymenobacter sp.]|jgi:hypothetical protein
MPVRFTLRLGWAICCVLTACNSGRGPEQHDDKAVPEKPKKQQGQTLAPPPRTTAAAATAAAPRGIAAPEEDSVQAYVGGQPMQYRAVPAADMPGYGLGADTVSGKFLVMRELDQRLHLLYPVGPKSGDWIDVRLERVGELDLFENDIAVDTVHLRGQPKAALCVSAQGHQGFWGASIETRGVCLIDISGPPVLLLKAETLHLDTHYGRIDETTYDDDAQGHEAQEQTVNIRDGAVYVSAPHRRIAKGQERERTSFLRPIPTTMVPAGQYRYQRGQLFRVGK